MFDALPRKILMTADAVGGVWTYALELARSLESHGVEFLIATMGPRLSAAQKRDAARSKNVTLIESDLRLEWMDEPWAEVDHASAWLLQSAANFEPELVHLNGYAHAALPWSAPVLVVAHSCVFSWWRAVKGEKPPARYDQYRERVRAGLAAAGLVVAPTAAMLDSLEENYGGGWRGVVIPNGRESRSFRAEAKEHFIFSAGRFWDEAKNLVALEAAAAAADWQVCVAGSGGADGAVVRLGNLAADEMASWLARAAIFCLPARYEPFGLAALEAALSGCALVLGDIESLREVWGDAALFVRPDDAEALASALQMLIADPARRQELAARAQTRAERYSLDRMAAGYLAIYSEFVRPEQEVERAA